MSLPRPSGTIFLSSSLSPRHTATHGARKRSAGNERLSPCTRARYQDASKRTRSRVSAQSRPPCPPQKFARENRSREPPLPHEHRLTLANVKWRPLLTSFSTLVRICPSSDSATMAVTLDRAADWPTRSRDAPGVRDWTGGSRRTGTPRLRPRRLSESLRCGPLVSVAPSCAIMAVYRPDATKRSAGSPRSAEIALLSRRGRTTDSASVIANIRDSRVLHDSETFVDRGFVVASIEIYFILGRSDTLRSPQLSKSFTSNDFYLY